MDGTKLIGKRIAITDRDSIYFGEWGIIAHFDGELYHVRIADGKDSMPVFDRSQFKVRRNQSQKGKG